MFVVCDDAVPLEVSCETREGGNFVQTYVLYVTKLRFL